MKKSPGSKNRVIIQYLHLNLTDERTGKSIPSVTLLPYINSIVEMLENHGSLVLSHSNTVTEFHTIGKNNFCDFFCGMNFCFRGAGLSNS